MTKRILALFIVIMLLLSVSLTVPLKTRADFGDYGGDGDYGGGDYDSDDGGDGGGELAAFLFELFWQLPIEWKIIVISVVALIIFIRSRHKKDSVRKGAEKTSSASLYRIDDYIKEIDGTFSESEFEKYVSELYPKLQSAWQAKDLSPLRPYLTNKLYAKTDTQLMTYRNNKQTNVMKNIKVLDVDIDGWYSEGDGYAIVTTIKTELIDYVVSDKNGKIVHGSDKKLKTMVYEWTFTRGNGSSDDVHVCPNCGAALDINGTAVCLSCGSVVTVSSSDWQLSEIKGISQRTAGGSKAKTTYVPYSAPARVEKLNPVSDYSAVDPGFDESDLIGKFSDLFIKYYACRSSENIDEMLPYLTTDFCEEEKTESEYRLRNELVENNENVTLLDVNIVGWKTVDGNDIMTFSFKARYRSSLIRKSDGVIMSGDPDTEVFFDGEWDLVRTSGVTTSAEAETHHCPYCGAPIDIYHSSKCEYCDSIVTVEANGWRISEMR